MERGFPISGLLRGQRIGKGCPLGTEATAKSQAAAVGNDLDLRCRKAPTIICSVFASGGNTESHLSDLTEEIYVLAVDCRANKANESLQLNLYIYDLEAASSIFRRPVVVAQVLQH